MKSDFLVLTAIFFLFVSCNKNERKLKIIDFSKPVYDTLIPTKNNSYAAAVYKINGSVNDTVLISYNGIQKEFFGDFKYKFNMDYYGGINVEFKFDPYKATKGNISITYGIY